MPDTKQVNGAEFPLVEKYRRQIPADLHGLLIPTTDLWPDFSKAIKRLRITEKERYYVCDLQSRYGLLVRPNESVKRTMIRVRLAILRLRRYGEDEDNPFDILGPLPVDPLE